jgi:DsbC/DsbD-like thiol-disulfide interchange protein
MNDPKVVVPLSFPPLSDAMRFAASVLLLVFGTAPALAGATAWQELGPDVRVRLITSDRLNADGTTLAAIELDMPQKTKTYWRVPGETGIPTRLDLAGSIGISGHVFHWPHPQIEKVGGYTDFVYYGPVVIPFELEIVETPAELVASLLLGICSEVCIPAAAEFRLPLDFDKPDTGQDIRISQAIAETPASWSGPGEPVGQPLFDSAAGLLWVPIDPAIVSPQSVIVDASYSGYLFGAPQKSQQEGLVSLPLLPSRDDGAGLAGAAVTMLFLTTEGPYEIARTVGLAPGAE